MIHHSIHQTNYFKTFRILHLCKGHWIGSIEKNFLIDEDRWVLYSESTFFLLRNNLPLEKILKFTLLVMLQSTLLIHIIFRQIIFKKLFLPSTSTKFKNDLKSKRFFFWFKISFGIIRAFSQFSLIFHSNDFLCVFFKFAVFLRVKTATSNLLKGIFEIRVHFYTSYQKISPAWHVSFEIFKIKIFRFLPLNFRTKWFERCIENEKQCWKLAWSITSRRE